MNSFSADSLPCLRDVEYFEDRYEILRRVGEGTYGAVFLVRPRRAATGERYVAKCLKRLDGFDGIPMTSVREVALHRTLRERLPVAERSRLALALEVLPSRRGGGEDEGDGGEGRGGAEVGLPGLPVLLFDYAPHSLARLLRRADFDFSTPWEVVHVVREVCRAVEAMHRCGVMHRDIKDDNVLVLEDGRVQLCDMGLAVAETDRARLTPSLVTFFYRPPEMLVGGGRYDRAVDVWCVGCLCAHAMLGRPVFAPASRQRDGDLAQIFRIVDRLGPLAQMGAERLSKAARTICEAVKGRGEDVEPFSEWLRAEVKRHGRPSLRDIHPAFIDLTAAALRMDPAARPSISELCAAEVFGTAECIAAAEIWRKRICRLQDSHTAEK